MAALQFAHVPSYSALLLRRTYADLALPGAIMDRAAAWLAGTDASWNGTDKRWTFPSGATLTFGYLDTDRDRFRYASAEFQFIGFDELTQFPEPWYRFLFSRLRKQVGMNVPLRMRAATNPGGIGHEWVRRRFLAKPDSPPFIPSRISDNPSVDSAAYIKSLEQLDPTTRKQLLEGVWIRDSGGLVYTFDDTRNHCEPVKTQFHILGIDYGFTDSTAFCVLGWRENDPVTYVVESFKRTGLTPSAAAECALELEQRYHFERIVGDIGGLGKGYAEEARDRFALPIEPAEKANKRGYIDLANGDLVAGRTKFIRGSNDGLVAEMSELPWRQDRSKPEDGFEDHLCDAFLYGWRASKSFTERLQPEKPKYGSTEYADALERRLEEAAERRGEEAQRQAALEWWEQ